MKTVPAGKMNKAVARAPANRPLLAGTGSQPLSRRAHGFTLIDVLVGIAIIAILASLLLPALSSAKAKAQAVVCMNNCKQLMIGWNLYAGDNMDVVAANDYPYNNPQASTPSTPPALNQLGSWGAGTMFIKLDANDPLGTKLPLHSPGTQLPPYVAHS